MNRWLRIALQAILVVAVPVVLAVMPIRVLMHPRWALFEYSRPNFPPDAFGFSAEERTRLAITGIDSIVGPRGVVVLQEARLADGSPAFNEREVGHMQDVRRVTSNIYLAQVMLLIAAVAAAIALTWQRATRAAVPGALLTGAIATVVLLVALVVFVLTGFDTFFTAFHRVFFSGDTWLFNYTDTLIRLYPEQFWFDAAAVIGVTTIVEAAALGAAAWWWGRTVQITSPSQGEGQSGG
jgi:integral membrane protein (TIGR01906 family)